MAMRFAPAFFVLLWSTGWIAAGFATRYAEPFTFLAIRFFLAGCLLCAFTFFYKGIIWPGRIQAFHAMICGALLHALYLCGTWWAIAHGVMPTMAGIITSLQPLLTAVLAWWLLQETLSRSQWFGFILGLSGLLIVMYADISQLRGQTLEQAFIPLLVNIGGIIAVTLGTLYQKHFLHQGHLLLITTWQYIGAFLVTISAALFFEDLQIIWNIYSISVMMWSVFALSIGAISLLLLLIRRGAVSKAASLIYLTPPIVALQGYFFFKDTLKPEQWAGMAVVVLGVYLVNRRGVKRNTATGAGS